MAASDTVQDLLNRLEASPRLEAAMLAEVRDTVAEAFPGAADCPAGQDVTNDALLLVDACVPGWTISLHGKAMASDGHWRCSLRESSSRDNDTYIGVGQGPTVAHALMAALLHLVQRGAHA